jgi:hypothetical protein
MHNGLLTINGQNRTVTTDPQRPLLEVLREDLKLTGTKYVILDRGVQMPESQGLRKVYDNEVVVYETPRPMRRAALYHAYQLGQGNSADLDLLYSESFPYMSVLILYEQPEYTPTLPDSVPVDRTCKSHGEWA